MAISVARRNRLTVAGLAAILIVMTGLVAASVPLYRWFCQATGYGGTTAVADQAPAPAAIVDRAIVVRFNGDVNSRLPWRFGPVQREVTVKLGEQHLAFFEARNLGDRPITGTATYNVTPAKAGSYFTKIDCFCFTEQRLAPGERVDMPVSFFVDPALADDSGLDDVTTITLSYTFFPVDADADADGRLAAAAGQTRRTTR